MITSRKFGDLPNGETVTAYDFTTEAGFRATILSYGATLQSLTLPDGTDIVLGFDTLESYLGAHPYFGAAIGRVANRIGGASFEIDEVRFEVPKNEGQNNLHSGPDGFDRANWFGEIDGENLILRHTSPDGHQGFPGELLTELHFSLKNSTLSLNIQAVTTKSCPVNITYHPYFNLNDGGVTPCTDHLLQINAKFFSHSDSQGIPTGDISNAPCSDEKSYNEPRPIKEGDCLDQNFVITSVWPEEIKMSKMAQLNSVITGHKVIICSTQNCLQAYTGGHIAKINGKSGAIYGPNHGIALEPQSFPDALNHGEFPDNTLHPGKIYSHKIRYTFRPGKAQA